MNKLLLIVLFLGTIDLLAQDSVVYKRKTFTGKIIDYSPIGVLMKNNLGVIDHYSRNYKRLVFSDTLVISHSPSFILENSLYDKKRKYVFDLNNEAAFHRVFLKNGVVFDVDYCFYEFGRLEGEDESVGNGNISFKRCYLEKIIYSDSSIVYFDSIKTNSNKKYPPKKFINSSKYYPYWTKKNFAGINLTNFLMCDLNLSYYRTFFKNRIDMGIGINIPIYSTSREVSNLSALNNQYYKFTKNYEFILSAEYYLFHSEFFKNLSVGLVYRHTNFNYTYVDNSDGYFKNDHYEFIENRTNRIANAGFITAGYFIPVRKRFFFKANLGFGWEEYNDSYQMQKGKELNGSSLAAYTNFMAGIKF